MFVKKRERNARIHQMGLQTEGGGASIRGNIFVSTWMGLYPGGALKWDFTVGQENLFERYDT